MKIITFINEKGGVGKTTIAVHVAQGLAATGTNVLLVDGDPQGHATVRCRLKKAPGLYDLLVRDADFKSVAKLLLPESYGIVGERLPDGKLWVIPSNVETRNIANSISDADLFARRLEELNGLVDVVIVDTSPTPSLLHGAFYTATDAVIYPTKLTYTAFDGLVESIKRRMAADVSRASRWRLPEIDVLGIIPVEYRRVTTEQNHNLDELRNHFGSLVWEPLPQRTKWQESENVAQPVWQVDPASDAAREAWGMIAQVRAAMGKEKAHV